MCFFAPEVKDSLDVKLEFIMELIRENLIDLLDDRELREFVSEDPSHIGDIVGFDVVKVEPYSCFT